VALTLTVIVGLGVTPALAQTEPSPEEKKQKIAQLKKSFKSGLQAAKANESTQAYTQLEQALQLAEDIGHQGATSKITGYLQKLPKNWGNTAIENESWGEALTHFDKGIKYAPEDAYMYYGKGLALVNMDSTQVGLKPLSDAIAKGNETGNTRVADLATTRIRDEFLAKASKSLNDQNPTTAQADTALATLDRMEQYVEPNASAMYYRSRALFEKEQFQQAVDAAEEGLSLHQGSRSDAAKYHFIVAESQLKLGSKQTACQRFQQATFGDYKARAEHYLKNECDG
jgi:tetratricopeptide (TPR) repeat protein